MKNRIIKAIVIMVTIAVLAGSNSVTASGYRETDSTDISCTLMAADKGLDKRNDVAIYHTQSIEDYNKLTPILENRNGKMIIEVIEATVLDDEGNGCDRFGFYVKYDSERFSKGDKVKSIFVYNPDTNYTDDFLYRTDILME